MVYHVLNRGNNRGTIFHKAADYDAFVDLLFEGKKHAKVEIFSFCLMQNHWHLGVRPLGDRDLAKFLSWVTNTHVKRYRAHYANTSGHLYQGRYKSFPVEADEHFLILCRYIEANPFRAKLIDDSARWRWSSACADPGWDYTRLLTEWPVDRPRNWATLINTPMREPQLRQVRTSIARDRPLGNDTWVQRVCKQLGLPTSIRQGGRPKTNNS
jgi:putative transposase